MSDTFPQSAELVWITGEKITLAELGTKNPAEILNSLHPPELKTALSCLFDGSDETSGNAVPEWAKRAASAAFKWFMPADGRSEPYQTGFMLGVACDLLPSIRLLG